MNYKLPRYLERVNTLLKAFELRREAFTDAQRQEFLIRHRSLESQLRSDLASGTEKWYDRCVELEQLHSYWCGMGGAASRPGDPQWYPSEDWTTFVNYIEPDAWTDTHMSPSDDTEIQAPAPRYPAEITEDPTVRRRWWPEQKPGPSAPEPLPPTKASLRKST